MSRECVNKWTCTQHTSWIHYQWSPSPVACSVGRVHSADSASTHVGPPYWSSTTSLAASQSHSGSHSPLQQPIREKRLRNQSETRGKGSATNYILQGEPHHISTNQRQDGKDQQSIKYNMVSHIIYQQIRDKRERLSNQSDTTGWATSYI